MRDPWGVEDPPAVSDPGPLPAWLAELATLTGRRRLAEGEDFRWPCPEDLPEVAALVAEGWRVLDADLFSRVLPGVWPREHRVWVPDRLPRVWVCEDDRGRRWAEPVDAEDREADDADLAAEAEEAGLPEPPAGRIWLLRSPWPSLAFEVLDLLVVQRCDERGEEEHLGYAAAMVRAAADLLSWREEDLWSWWAGPTATVARAWRERGRAGDDAAAVVLAGLGPEHVGTLTAPTGRGGEGLTEAQAVAWALTVDEEHDEDAGAARDVVARVRAWRALGLPDDPPPELAGLASWMSPYEAGSWLAAGFDLGDVRRLHPYSLVRALAWRDAGYSVRATADLLHADYTLTPDEATAFTARGLPHAACVAWVEHGFDAATAAAWDALGILPNEARVWRASGLGPDDARAHRAGHPDALLPPGPDVGWTALGSGRAAREYDVTDPPGTRGRVAADAVWKPEG